MPVVQPVIIPFKAEAKALERKIDELTRDFDKFAARCRAAAASVGQAAKVSASSWTEFRSMYSTVLDVVRVGQQVWQKTIGISQEYANTVREMSLISGASAQKTSLFIQVLDDYNISAEDAATATKALTKEGYAPTIETLAELSDQYIKLKTTQEKNEFVLKNLGKSGLQWVEVLNKGSAAILKQGDAVNSSLILNKKQLEASKALFLELDDLEDASKGLGTAIGNYLTPAMQVLIHTTTGSSNSLAEWFAQLAENRTISIEMSRIMKEQGLLTKWGTSATEEQIGAIRMQAIINIRATEATQANSEAQDDSADALEAQKEAVKRASQALDDYKAMLDEVSKANQDAESFIQSYADGQKKYADSHADAIEKVKQAEYDLRVARKEAKSDESVDNASMALQDAKQAVQDLESQWHESYQKMIYDAVLAKVSVDGLTDAEFKATQDLAVQMGIRSQADADAAKAAMDKASAIADGISMQEDVMNEKAGTDAKLLELENAKAAAAGQTAQVVIDGSLASAQAIQQVSASTDGEIARQYALAAAARATSAAYSSIKYGAGQTMSTGARSSQGLSGSQVHSRDAGGFGLAGQSYAIGTGAQPEVFTPATNGYFSPNADKGGGGTVVYNIVVNNPKGETTENSVRKTLRLVSATGEVG